MNIDCENFNGSNLIQTILEGKKLKNPAYSLRALSRDLKISQPQLCNIIKKKRKLSPSHALKIGQYLQLNDQEILKLVKMTLE